MSSTIKRRKGMSPTTVVLILVLLGAVAGASRLVSPPPPGPPAEVKVDKTEQSAKAKEMMQQHMSELKGQQAMQQKYMNKSSIPTVKDPGAIDVSNDYFRTHKPGEAGLNQVDKEVKEQTAAYQEYQRKRAAEEAKSHAPAANPAVTSPK